MTRWGEGPAGRPLELTKLLAELGKATFRASGTCMYPGVRPGDLLHVEPRTARQISVGEIAVFRREGRLFAHRTIATGEDTLGPYIVTRPDRAVSGSDGPSHDRDLLGVVSRIERDGRVLAPAPEAFGRPARAWHFCCLALLERRQAALAKLLRLLAPVQQTGLYRLVAGFWFARTGRTLDYVIETPLHSHRSSPFSRKLAGREVDAFDLGADAPHEWTITLRVDHRPAASLSFSRSPEECPDGGWRLAGADTRIRYRGTGVDEKLFRKAAEILARSGVSSVRMSLPEGSPDLRNGATWVSRSSPLTPALSRQGRGSFLFRSPSLDGRGRGGG